ncbi:SDR family NAD(P)-dependent oxidoreductase [Actinomadura atramentaria]|uniref:SDR family NAD(P)-dependent oxidoreductase n=1 Tax=Actinomadura atramentaria TaxID=1990 RepID=UPI0003612D3A|nr:SDR family NAD(P)-dependent oxidoreductase [Actinomadura atramentaria]
MRGKTVLVTGSTGGIGKETARALAARGARVVLVGRDRRRADAAARELGAGGAAVSALTADLSRLAGLRALAAEMSARHDRVDVLVNNLGGMTASRALTGDGVETTFATNVLAPYALTCLLLPLLRAAPAARVVNLTGGIRGGPVDPSNLEAEKRFLGWTFSQYNHAKTALMAMSRRFAARLADDAVTVNVAYPGHAHTPGNQAMTAAALPYAYRPLAPVLRFLGPRLLNDLAKPARSSVYLAASPDMEGVTGVYVDARAERAPWPAAVRDESVCDAVWDRCERHSRLTP